MISSLKRPVKAVMRAGSSLKRAAREAVFRLQGRTHYPQRFYEAHLDKGIRERTKTDICDHLNTLFFMAVSARPRLLVELGTRGGESTRALLCAAAFSDAVLLSVDIDDCAGLDLPHREHWRFVKADDLDFGVNRFKQWCGEEGVGPSIDVLFIDTSHECEHTRKEIRVWSPYLAESGVMIFHDSNTRNGVYARTDGSFGYSVNRGRGVIQPIEEFMGRQYDENAYFTDYANGFLMLHFPHCNGLTILKKHCPVAKKEFSASEALKIA